MTDCFFRNVLGDCRENLSKDLYLISQMDSDQFVPIWTIACMEDIKALTTDMALILDVLRGNNAALLPAFVQTACGFNDTLQTELSDMSDLNE